MLIVGSTGPFDVLVGNMQMKLIGDSMTQYPTEGTTARLPQLVGVNRLPHDYPYNEGPSKTLLRDNTPCDIQHRHLLQLEATRGGGGGRPYPNY